MAANLPEEHDNKVVNISTRMKEKWRGEPDFIELFLEDYHLVVLRTAHFGNLNGYVGVRRNHPYFGLSTSSEKIMQLHVHGGVTFADKGKWIPGMKKKYWYIGFDTAHAWDYAPLLEEQMQEIREFTFGSKEKDKIFKDMSEFSLFNQKKSYRDIEYVSKQVESLYEQIKAVKDRNPGYQFNPVREYRRLTKIKKQHEQMEKAMMQFRESRV